MIKKYICLFMILAVSIVLFSCNKNNDISNTETQVMKASKISVNDYANNQIDRINEYETIADNSNFKMYKYHIGTLANVPISYGNGMGFDGIPIDLECSTEFVSQDTISNAIEECVSKINTTETTGPSFSIGGSVSNIPIKFLELANISFDVNFGEERKIETLEETTKQTYESSSTYIKSYGEKISYPLNSDYCQIGYKYRLVLTTAFNVYMLAIYDKVLDKITSYYYMEQIPNEMTMYIEECEKNKLWSDNDFINLEYPEIDPEKDGIKENSTSGNLVETYKRDYEVSIKTSDYNMAGHFDQINILSLFGYTYNELYRAGYTKIYIEFTIDIREDKYDGYQLIYIYSDYGEVANFEIEHGPGYKNEQYGNHYRSIETNLDRFSGGNIIFKYSSHGNYSDYWRNKNLNVTITLSK